MSLKYKWKKVVIELVPSGGGAEATAMVYFAIRDDASVGKLLEEVSDSVQFSVSFPVSKADIKTQALTAITAKYSGAAAE